MEDNKALQEKKDHFLENIINDLNNTIQPSAKEELEQWLAASTENKQYYHQLQQIWLTLNIIDDAQQYDSQAAFQRFKQKVDAVETPLPVSKRRSIGYYLKYAAVIATLVTMSYLSYDYFNKDTDDLLALNSISVPKGSTSTMEFKDGSKLWLNSETQVEIDNSYRKKERRIRLVGEAFLEVTKNPSAPFVVETEEVEVKVLGTTFNVNASTDSEYVRVTLESGKVELLFNDGQSLLLDPNMQAVYNIKNKSIHVEEVNTRKVTAWKNNYLIFTGETFDEIMTTLEDKFRVKIIIKRKALKKSRFAGDFMNNESLDEILTVMSANGRFTYKRDINTIEIR